MANTLKKIEKIIAFIITLIITTILFKYLEEKIIEFTFDDYLKQSFRFTVITILVAVSNSNSLNSSTDDYKRNKHFNETISVYACGLFFVLFLIFNDIKINSFKTIIHISSIQTVYLYLVMKYQIKERINYLKYLELLLILIVANVLIAVLPIMEYRSYREY
jgi:hypothetical protein